MVDVLFARFRGHKDYLSASKLLPLSYLYLQKALEDEGISCRIIDGLYNWLEPEELLRRISEEQFQWLCLSVPCAVYLKDTIELATTVKKMMPHVRVILGGHIHFQPLHRRILGDYADIEAIVVGDGESALPALIRYLGGDTSIVPHGATLRGIDSDVVSYPPVPTFADLSRIRQYDTSMIVDAIGTNTVKDMTLIGSRGCYGGCSYCSCYAQAYHSDLPSAWRGRDPVDIVDQMCRYSHDLGSVFFNFLDANFFGPGSEFGKERALAFCDSIRKSGLKCKFDICCRADNVDNETFQNLRSVGLERVFLGMESASSNFLCAVNKERAYDDTIHALHVLDHLGILAQVGFIMFFPWSTTDDIRQNIRALQRVGSKVLISDINNYLFLYPGTAAEEAARQPLDFAQPRYYMDRDFWGKWTSSDQRVRLYYMLVRGILGPWLNYLYSIKMLEGLRPHQPEWQVYKRLEAGILDCMLSLLERVQETDLTVVSETWFEAISLQLRAEYDRYLVNRADGVDVRRLNMPEPYVFPSILTGEST